MGAYMDDTSDMSPKDLMLDRLIDHVLCGKIPDAFLMGDRWGISGST